MQAQAQRLTLPNTIYAIKRFGEAMADLKGSYQPQLPLELALIEAVNGAPMATVALAPVQAAATAPIPAATHAPATAPAQTAPGKETPAKPATPEAAPPADEPPPLDQAAVKKLRDQWKAFQSQVKSDLGVKVWAALNSVRDIAVAEQGVAFAFGNNTFAQQMIAAPENHGRMVAILTEFLGRPVQLECQVGEQARLMRAVASDSGPEHADGADPLVDYAVAHLGAQVIEPEEIAP